MSEPASALRAWRLAQEAPPLQARALLLEIGDAAALPKRDRDDFARLRALAGLHTTEELLLSAQTICVATLRGHKDLVSSLAVTPDGSLLASGSNDGTICLWRLPGGQRSATLRGHKDRVCFLAITPDGRLLSSASRDHSLRLWHLPSGRCAMALLRRQGHVNAVTPDGSLLASAGWDKTISLCRLPDGACVTTLRGHKDVVVSLAVTPDGSLLASGSWDGTIRLWRLPGGECVATLLGHEYSVLSVAFSPDGSLLASGSDDNTVRLWRLPGGECAATLRGYGHPIDSLAVTPNGSLLTSSSATKTIRLWRSEIATLAATPIAALARDHHRLLTLRRDAGADERERAWLDLMLALIDYHRRYDVEIAATTHVVVGETDIEIGE